MNQNDYFKVQSNRIIHENPISGKYYVLYIDITDFHLVNYIYGNESGDLLLQEMNDFLDRQPFVLYSSRLFADFFLGLCFWEDGADINRVIHEYDNELRKFLADQQIKYPSCKLKAASGICQLENGDIEKAIDNANMARKVSKHQFTLQTIRYNQDMKDQITALHENELEIYHALQENRFCFYLQPKVDLTSGRIIGAEALARCRDKDGRITNPDKFIDIMEAKGSVIDLDQIICRQVCAFLRERIDKGLPVVCISVNLSRLHIQNPATASLFHSIVSEYQIPPDLLEFELTETILLEEFAEAKTLIDQLRFYGYHVSIDDFGSGYAGINVWQELSFDCLKLDKKFLSDDPVLKKRNRALVPNIINIAHRLHVQVLCEGVETEEQCLYLLRLGCTLVQGYYFSKPLPPQELFGIYEQQNGIYPLPALLCPEKTDGWETQNSNVPGSGNFRVRIKNYLFVILCCGLLLGICITGVMAANRKRTRQEFTRMIKETLNAYTAGQRENTLTEIEGVVGTLQSLEVLIREGADPEFLDAYLLALNKESSKVKYMYYSSEKFYKLRADKQFRDEDVKVLERLERGETVITDIVFSERMGNIYCVGVGVPVMEDGRFVGAVQGIIRAEALISTKLYDRGLGQISAVFLTDKNSKILPIRNSGGDNRAGRYLLDLLKEGGISEDAMEEIREAYYSDDCKARSIRIGSFGGNPYYFAMTGLGYNDWYLVVCLKADSATTHFRYIVYNMRWSISVLIASLLLAFAAMVFFWGKVQKKALQEEQRYLLLEHFSDTVLFDYNCVEDTIRFTSNASKLFFIHGLTQKGFMLRLQRAHIYAGDLEEIIQVVNGQMGGELGEIRIRLMRPDIKEYFWCLVQYQNLYEKGVLKFIIGKITDIDGRMPYEEYGKPRSSNS